MKQPVLSNDQVTILTQGNSRSL